MELAGLGWDWRQTLRNILGRMGTVLNIFPSWDKEPPEPPSREWLNRKIQQMDLDYIELLKEVRKLDRDYIELVKDAERLNGKGKKE